MVRILPFLRKEFRAEREDWELKKLRDEREMKKITSATREREAMIKSLSKR